MAEDDTFNKLRRVPLEELLPTFMKNLNDWDLEQRASYIHSIGWTINDFNIAFSEYLKS